MVGFAATRLIDAATVELAGIIVGRAAAGRGTGTGLVELALDAARRDGLDLMVVRTERTNDRAIRFYRARGFEPGAESVEAVGDVEVPVVELTVRLEPRGRRQPGT